jgi:hypothetical protein
MKKFAVFPLTGLLLVSALILPVLADPFLCPVVGDGVLNADEKNGDNGVEAIEPPVGTSLLPGQNKAGEKSNSNAHNSDGPGNPDAGPGQNPDYTPIWP